MMPWRERDTQTASLLLREHGVILATRARTYAHAAWTCWVGPWSGPCSKRKEQTSSYCSDSTRCVSHSGLETDGRRSEARHP
eukprot:s307_g11.t1